MASSSSRAAEGSPRGTPRFRERVEAAIRALRPGEVASYGDIAAEAGAPGAARAVGAVLARSGGSLPWWRVVTATGRLVPGHEVEHARRLIAEGVALQSGRVARHQGGASPEDPGAAKPPRQAARHQDDATAEDRRATRWPVAPSRGRGLRRPGSPP